MSNEKQEIEDYKEFLQDMEQDRPASITVDGNPNHFTEQIDLCDEALKRIDKSLKVITFSHHDNGYYVCSEPNGNAGQYVTLEAHNADLELIRADYGNTVDELCNYAWGRVYGEGKTDWEYPVQAIRHLVTFCDEKDAEIEKLKAEVASTRKSAIEFATDIYNLAMIGNPGRYAYEGSQIWFNMEPMFGGLESVIDFLLSASILEKHPENNWYRLASPNQSQAGERG